ncbi:MAG: DUF3883 domain-containing protein [Chthoniobacterales bacterium]
MNALGLAGEKLVLRYERERLARIGQARLAGKIVHTSATESDSLGFDILSFEADGRERLIEMKTTRFGSFTTFFASRNEVEVSAQRQGRLPTLSALQILRTAEAVRLAGLLASLVSSRSRHLLGPRRLTKHN